MERFAGKKKDQQLLNLCSSNAKVTPHRSRAIWVKVQHNQILKHMTSGATPSGPASQLDHYQLCNPEQVTQLLCVSVVNCMMLWLEV